MGTGSSMGTGSTMPLPSERGNLELKVFKYSQITFFCLMSSDFWSYQSKDFNSSGPLSSKTFPLLWPHHSDCFHLIFWSHGHCTIYLNYGRAGAEEVVKGKDKEGPRVTQKVFFDLALDGQPAGRLVIGLYGDAVPKTAMNFSSLGKTSMSQKP